MDKPGLRKVDGTWTAFLAMAFAVLGMTGLIASFITPIPLHRAIARDAALDDALAAESPARLQALRPRLDDSAGAILPASPDLPLPADLAVRVARERAAMHARFLAEAAASSTRMTWMVLIVTVMAAAFGAAVLRIAGRTTPGLTAAQNLRKPEAEASNTRVT